jgi:hypothetical protein
MKCDSGFSVDNHPLLREGVAALNARKEETKTVMEAARESLGIGQG